MRHPNFLLLGVVLLGTGCSCFPTTWSVACKDEGWPVLPGQKVEKRGADKPEGPPPSALPILGSQGQCYRYRIKKKAPEALLEWRLCKEKENGESEEEEDKQKDQKDSQKEGNGEKKEN